MNKSLRQNVRVRVLSGDVPGLLRQMTEVFSATGVNIQHADIRTTKDDKAISVFDVQVRDTQHLADTMEALNKLKGVLGVTRMTKH